MNFSTVPNNTIGKLLRTILKVIPRQTQVRIVQGRLKGRKWIVGSGVHGCWLGSYELDKQKLFERTIQPGKVVYDLGANVGFYTLLSSVIVGASGKVYAFEPLPRNINYLRQHMKINQVENVQIIEAAISDKTGEVTFNEGADPSTGRIDGNGAIYVKCVALDQLYASNEVLAPDFMKIDIEGGELLALQGARQIIEKHHPVIFLATHGNEVHVQCLKLLASFGYEVRSVDQRSMEETDEVIATYH